MYTTVCVNIGLDVFQQQNFDCPSSIMKQIMTNA